MTKKEQELLKEVDKIIKNTKKPNVNYLWLCEELNKHMQKKPKRKYIRKFGRRKGDIKNE